MIRRLCLGFASRVRIAWLRARGVRILGPASLRAVEIPRHAKCVTLCAGAALDRGVTLLATHATARIVIGARVYLNRHTMLDAAERIEIGEGVMIGPFCYLTDHDHTAGLGFSAGDGPLISRPTIIGARCWLGAHVTVLKGVTIGEGTVVGAGSVVTKSLPANVVAVGNPARVFARAMSAPLSCAVMIATRNRRDDLARTCTVLRTLDPAPDEVLICADGCADDTVELVRREFPDFQLVVNASSLGSTQSRDHLMRRARSDVVLSLDDDSHPLERDAIARLREIFATHPRVAVASFPQRTDEFPESLTSADFGRAHFAGTYVNCACAFRRAVFIALGGHFGPFWNAYDEPDFALRCAAAGWQVRFDPAVTIRHYFSGVNRNHLRMHHLHARNEIWSVLLRCPLPQLFAVIAFRAARQFAFAWKWSWRWIFLEPRWWLACLAGAPAALARRRPVPWKKYRAWMSLIRRPLADEAQWKAQFAKT